MRSSAPDASRLAQRRRPPSRHPGVHSRWSYRGPSVVCVWVVGWASDFGLKRPLTPHSQQPQHNTRGRMTNRDKRQPRRKEVTLASDLLMGFASSRRLMASRLSVRQFVTVQNRPAQSRQQDTQPLPPVDSAVAWSLPGGGRLPLSLLPFPPRSARSLPFSSRVPSPCDE